MTEALNAYKAVLAEFEKALDGDDLAAKVHWAKQENKTLHEFPILKGKRRGNGGRSDECYKAFVEFLDRGSNRYHLTRGVEKIIEELNNDKD